MTNYVMPIENISPSLQNFCNQPTCMLYVCSVFSTKQNDNFYKHFFESFKGKRFYSDIVLRECSGCRTSESLYMQCIFAQSDFCRF